MDVLNNALKSSFPDFGGLYYDWQARSILTNWDKTGICSFADLSDGQRNIVLLYSDIVRRMCLLNPHLAGDVTQKTDGVVLIDELDAHLHPDWQQKVVSGLKRSFPCVQFVVSTHSPSVITEVEEQKIFYL